MKSFTALLVVLIVAAPMQAQEREPLMNLGGFAAYGLNSHASDFKALPGVPCCSPMFESGSGSGFSAGVLAGLPLSSGTQIQLRLGYQGLHGTLLRDELIGNTLVRGSSAPFDTTTVDIMTQHSIEATLHTVFLEPTFVWSPLRRLGIHAGVSGALLLTKDFYQKEELQTPSTVVFTGTESRVRNEADGSIPDANPLLLHAVAGVSYDLPVGMGAVLAPEVRLRVPLNSIAGVDWKVSALSFGAAFKVDIMAPEPVRYERDTILQRDTAEQVIAGIGAERVHLMRTEERLVEERSGARIVQTLVVSEHYRRDIPAQRPDVRLTIAGLKRDGSRTDIPVIVVEEVLIQESFPLVPYVFFRRHDAVLDDTRQQLLSAPEQFDTTALEFSALAVHSDLLNILGQRMKRFPEGSIVITGCNGGVDENNDGGLSQRRAEEVRRYLRDVWAIRPERIQLKSRDLPEHPSNTATADGREENSRAEIAATDPRLLAPVVLRSVDRTITPPMLECTPELLSPVSLSTWHLLLKGVGNTGRNGTVVLLDTGAAGMPVPVRLQPEGYELVDDSLLVGQLTVTTDDGQTAVAEQRIPLRQLTITRRQGDSATVEIERFSLVLFDYNSADIDVVNHRILQQVRQRVRPASRVRIVGYTDRTGDPDYNKKLAARRCREVQRLLGMEDALIETVGSDRLLYDNDLPEGRMYSRTVHIIIETPVEKDDGTY